VAQQPAAAAAAGAEPLVTRVILNGEPKGDFFVFRTAAGDFLVKADDLRAMGLRAPEGVPVQIDGEAHVPLRSAPGVTFSFDAQKAVLAITAEASLLPRHELKPTHLARAMGTVPTDNSAFFNYALSYADGSSYTQTKLGLTTEAGLRWGKYLFLTDGATLDRPDGSRKFVRLMSHMIRDDRERLQRVVAGDFFTPTRDFSIGANVGGVSLSKLYDLNPYLVQYPTQSIRGNVALPSDLEVYVDGQRIRTERLSPGEFELQELVGHSGARSVQVLLRDSFGRVQQLSYDFYVSELPLRQGLHEYSYNLGALRRNFGFDSNNYGQAAYSMFHRVGLTDALTVGLSAEGTRKLFSGGPSATVVLGSAGVLNMALARSSIAGHQGTAASLGYSYQGRDWTFGLQARRDWGEFAALSEPIYVTNRKYEAGASATVQLGGGAGWLSLAHNTLGIYPGRVSSSASPTQPFAVSIFEKRRVTTLSYGVPLVSGRSSLTASLRHIKDSRGSRNEAFVGITFFPDRDHTVHADVRADSERVHSGSIQLTKLQPIGEGLGYTLSADRFYDPAGTDNTQLRSSAQYNAPAALVRGEFNVLHNAGQVNHERRLTLAGGLAYVGNRVVPGRPITESFALVKVGEVPGVEVSLNGLPAGKTNAQGELFIPSLHAHYDNEISLRSSDIPIDYAVDKLKLKIAPALRSGTVVAFDAAKVQAITGRLKYQTAAGTVALENQLATFTMDGKRHTLRTARGGEFYLENIKPGTYPAEANTPGGRCSFDLVIPRSDETFLDLPDIVCRPAR
jgi:outer membrane usher protein FimD/PapC